MQKTYKVLLAMLGTVALIASINSCGGSSLSLNEESAFVGITDGDFKAVRYNEAGYRDGSLNPTMDMTVVEQGNATVVTIAVSDSEPARTVAIDLRYNPEAYSPGDIQFAGLMDTPVQMAHTGNAGLVAVGQSDPAGISVRSGDFVTVTFAHRPFAGGKAVQAVHSLPVNTAYTANGADIQGFAIAPTTIDSGNPGVWTCFALFAGGDGDGNGESNISDLTPIAAALGTVTSPADLSGAKGDYDRNGEVNISDLTPLAANLGNVTSGIEIMIGDAADATNTVLGTVVDWTAGSPANSGAPTTSGAHEWRNWTGQVTDTDAQGADTNSDGTVFVSARTTDGSSTGTAFTGIQIDYGTPPPQNFVISNFDVDITGATGGSGTGGLFVDGDTLGADANTDLTLDITGISGTYNGTPFTPADAGGSVPQVEYDAALASVISNIDWAVNSAGAAGMRATGPVLGLSSTSGSGITATVFPDDDPESTGASAEGTLDVTASASGSFIPGAITYNYLVDVDVDDTAPLVDTIAPNPDMGLDGNGDVLLSAVATTTLTLGFDFGTGGAPGTINASTIGAQLYHFESGTGTDLTWVSDTPDAAGEFNVLGGGPFLLNALLTPGMVAAGQHYSVRIFDVGADAYNSVNKPGPVLTLAPLPAAAPLTFFPWNGDIADPHVGPDTTWITIIWPDPVVRRNGDQFVKLPENTVMPLHQGGFDDVLKTSGNEFQITPIAGGLQGAMVTWATGTDPSLIGPNTPFDDAINLSVFVAARHPDRIVCDILSLPNGTNLGDPAEPYAFKVFGAPTDGTAGSRPAIGYGHLSIDPLPISEAAIVGVDWGVNIFDGSGEGDLALGARDFSAKSATISTFVDNDDSAGNPDCIWVEFNGGIVGSDTPSDNVSLTFKNLGDDSMYEVPMKVVVGGLGTGGLNFLGFHAFSTFDVNNGINPGNLVGGGTFELYIKDGNDVGDGVLLTSTLFVNN